MPGPTQAASEQLNVVLEPLHHFHVVHTHTETRISKNQNIFKIYLLNKQASPAGKEIQPCIAVMCLENYTELILKPSTKYSESYMEPEKFLDVKLLAGIQGWCCPASVTLKGQGEKWTKDDKMKQRGQEHDNLVHVFFLFKYP